MTMALFSGGGSGGHVFPGLAVASELLARGWEVSWAGSERGLEARLVPARNVDFHSLPARPVMGRGLLGKLRAIATLLGAAVPACRLVRRLDARVVVGTGGYASAPGVMGARLAGRPVFLIEPNAAPGAANRFLSRFAAGAAVAWDETRAALRCPAWTTGVPIRPEFFDESDELPERSLAVVVLGGSQGARQLNELLPGALAGLGLSDLKGTEDGVRILHQTGQDHVDAARNAYAAAGLDGVPGVEVEIVPFVDDVAAVMRRSHLVISRAGAITLAEICAAGRPSLLVPLTIAAGHQVENARRLVDAGAAEMLAPGGGSDELTALLAGLVGDRRRLAAMGAAARALARAGAAREIADHVVAVARVPQENGDGGSA